MLIYSRPVHGWGLAGCFLAISNPGPGNQLGFADRDNLLKFSPRYCRIKNTKNRRLIVCTHMQTPWPPDHSNARFEVWSVEKALSRTKDLQEEVQQRLQQAGKIPGLPAHAARTLLEFLQLRIQPLR